MPYSPRFSPRLRNSCLGLLSVALLLLGALSSASVSAAEPLRLLFLGDNGPHRPADRFAQLAPVLSERGIRLDYTDRLESLDPEVLAPYDGLVIYANQVQISSSQESALLDFVASGKGFIPLHCASYCFHNSDAYIELVGAQFHRHGGETVSPVIVRPDHPVMRGYHGFESWDETYVHHRHNEENRIVLEERRGGMQADGRQSEPWTWVRTHGRGRVFYTAWGHDHRTWGNPGFQNLVERGIRWACGGDPAEAGPFGDPHAFVPPRMTELPDQEPPFEYIEVGSKIPNYVAGARWGVQGDPLTQMQKPLPPEESMKRFVVPEGFELQLFASEPQLGGKPIAMNWDARGRLWVCETIDYPNELQPRNRGRDRIRICEDTTGDGRADTFTVFAEELSIPTTLEFHRGGVIVQNGSETLYLADTTGDDVADVREVLISGWAMGDTHGGVSNFRYGPDNWIWAMQGYNLSRPRFAGGRSTPFRQGFFRFKVDDSDPPQVTDVEFVRSTSNNTWGLGFSEEGLVFGSTANRDPSVYMPFANRYYEAVRGWSPQLLAASIADTHRFEPITDRVRQVDHHGGYTAGAGHALYTGRAYPPMWWNKTAFVCGPTGHLVGTFVLSPEGAGFRSTSPSNLVASDDEWAAPIQAEVGPDGNVWILDWYNYIIQHNPTPQGFETGAGNAYETELRDKKYGRIYRLVYTGETSPEGPQGSAPAPSLAGAEPAELVDALRHPSMLWRLRAQQQLVERGESDVVAALSALAAAGDPDAIGMNAGAMHALWTLQGLGAIDSPDQEGFAAAVAQLSNRAAGVRRAAVSVLPPRPESATALLEAGTLSDPEPQVRLAALLKLAEVPAHAEVGEVIARRMAQGSDAEDRWLREAMICAAARHVDAVLPALAADRVAARAVDSARILADHAARNNPELDAVAGLIRSLAEAEASLAAAVIEGLRRGWPREHRLQIDPETETIALGLVDRLPTAAQSQLVSLGEALGSSRLSERGAGIARELLAEIASPDQRVRARTAAAQRLVEFRPEDPEIVEGLLDLVTPQTDPTLAAGIIAALESSRAENVGPVLVDRAAEMTPGLREVTLRVLLARPETTLALLEGIESRALQLSDLALNQREELRSHPQRRIRQQFEKLMEQGGGLPSADRQEVVDRLLAVTEMAGDVAHGRTLYVKHCANCHVMRGEGGNVGPDLTGMAVHPKEELLVHILDPNRSVEGNYRTYTVLLDDGRVLNGLLAAESRTSIEIVDAQAQRTAIPRDEIEQLIASQKSLMPDGFEQQMSEQELADLLEYLTDTGPFVPVSLASVANVDTSEPMFHRGGSRQETLALQQWDAQMVGEVPFVLLNPKQAGNNAVMLHGPRGDRPPTMPKSVSVPVAVPVARLHLLSGVSGWGAPFDSNETVSMIVRIHYADGETEDHPLVNGRHFADYIRRVDVPESEHVIEFSGGQQMRYVVVQPQRTEPLQQIELVKGDDGTAPIVMALTVEKPAP